MRNENMRMLSDTMSIFRQGYYTFHDRQVELKLSQTEMR